MLNIVIGTCKKDKMKDVVNWICSIEVNWQKKESFFSLLRCCTVTIQMNGLLVCDELRKREEECNYLQIVVINFTLFETSFSAKFDVLFRVDFISKFQLLGDVMSNLRKFLRRINFGLYEYSDFSLENLISSL